MKSTFSILLKSGLLALLLLLYCPMLFSQENAQKKESNFWKNLRFGGGLGLGVSNGFFSATVAPTAVYQFSNQYALGIGLNGTFNSRRNAYKSTILGGSIISLYNPLNEIQLSAEFEQLNVNRDFDEDFVSNIDRNYWYPAMFLGAGYRTGNVIVGIRYDVIYDEDRSIYPNSWMPFFRVFF